MKPAAFEYFAPQTIDEAIALLAAHDQARPLAGGQSLVPMMNLRLARPPVLVDINRVSELAGIEEQDGELRIGSMTRQAALLHSADVQRASPLMTEALACVGHPPTRARGTIGGSLSNADPAAELPVVMLALDAVMIARAPGGERAIAAGDFFVGMFETALDASELLTRVLIPARRADQFGTFLEVARRKGDFAIVSVAVNLALDDQARCTDARLVFGAIGPVPVRSHAAERALVGETLTEQAMAAAAAAVDANLFELESHGASRDYRIRVARTLVRRALQSIHQRRCGVA